MSDQWRCIIHVYENVPVTLIRNLIINLDDFLSLLETGQMALHGPGCSVQFHVSSFHTYFLSPVLFLVFIFISHICILFIQYTAIYLNITLLKDVNYYSHYYPHCEYHRKIEDGKSEHLNFPAHSLYFQSWVSPGIVTGPARTL